MSEPNIEGNASGSALGFEESLSTVQQRYGALAVCAMLVAVAVLGASFGMHPGPVITPFIPMTATVWLLADLLTGFLLVAQFYVNGNPMLGILAGGYALSGLLTLPYVFAFPGLFRAAPLPVGDQQISITLWALWHCSFPIIVTCAALTGARSGRIVSRARVRLLAAVIVVAPFVAAIVVSALVIALRAHLPHVIIDGHFQLLWRSVYVPAVVALNAIACLVTIGASGRLSGLKLWLGVAMFASALDALLNLSATRYSYAWDAGKLITVFTASVVLIMILCDIVELYGRLARVARIDVLTSLANRRAFEEHFELVFANARRLRTGMALLVVDVDFFKHYNDSRGHLAGDACLQRVAGALSKCATRPLDLVSRYGGEEFAVVLPDTPLAGVLATAERIRSVVERLEIVYDGKGLGRVTVSVGVAYAPDARTCDETALFETADLALYEAKDRGRNCVVLRGQAESTSAAEVEPAAVNSTTSHPFGTWAEVGAREA